MLYAKELPTRGGDTMFASMYAAYDALSPGMQKMLSGLKAIHSGIRAFGPKAQDNNEGRDAQFKLSEIALKEVEHPVICTHAGSGRKYLYVNRGFTIRLANMTEAESKPLLDYLYAHAARPEFTCRFNWRPGAIAFWDNLCTQHFALNDYHGSRRLMHRITIRGRAPQA
jgi:taurine dioxygenase